MSGGARLYYSVVDIAAWTLILSRLPRPLEEEEVITDLRVLARVAEAEGGDPLTTLPGRKALAKRWGWEGEPGEGRARRLVANPRRWADAVLLEMIRKKGQGRGRW